MGASALFAVEKLSPLTMLRPFLNAQAGGRVGRGKGYYDRFLAKVQKAAEAGMFPVSVSGPKSPRAGERGAVSLLLSHAGCHPASRLTVLCTAGRQPPHLLGVAFPCQMLPNVPLEPHDVPLHAVAEAEADAGGTHAKVRVEASAQEGHIYVNSISTQIDTEDK